MSEQRADLPRAGLFNQHADAVAEAMLRAALTFRRYRVRYDAANRWWQITELTEVVASSGRAADTGRQQG